jgi:hypothetical protein
MASTTTSATTSTGTDTATVPAKNIMDNITHVSGFTHICNEFKQDKKINENFITKGIGISWGGTTQISGIAVIMNPFSHILGSFGSFCASGYTFVRKICNYFKGVAIDLVDIFNDPCRSLSSIFCSTIGTLIFGVSDILQGILSGVYCITAIVVTIIGGAFVVIFYFLPCAIGKVFGPIFDKARS